MVKDVIRMDPKIMVPKALLCIVVLIKWFLMTKMYLKVISDVLIEDQSVTRPVDDNTNSEEPVADALEIVKEGDEVAKLDTL